MQSRLRRTYIHIFIDAIVPYRHSFFLSLVSSFARTFTLQRGSWNRSALKAVCVRSFSVIMVIVAISPSLFISLGFWVAALLLLVLFGNRHLMDVFTFRRTVYWVPGNFQYYHHLLEMESPRCIFAHFFSFIALQPVPTFNLPETHLKMTV